MKKRVVAVLLVLAMSGSLMACGQGGGEKKAETDVADMVLTNGTIQLMTSEEDTAEAIAVKDGEIIYVGTSDEAEKYVGDDTETIDLDGKYVLPGFVDGHIHAPGFHESEITNLNLMDYGADLEAYKTALKEFVEKNPDFEIYNVDAMDLKAFPDSIPTHEWIDEICPDKPVVIIDLSHHGKLLNAKAMEMAGLSKDTPDPDSGKIYRYDDGELTGYFSDYDGITGLPEIELTEEQEEEAFLSFQEEANSFGIVAIDSGGDSMPLEMFEKLENEDKLNLRINTNFFASAPLGKEEAEKTIKRIEDNQKYVTDFVNVRQVKFTLDGVPEGQSSYLLEPYAETAGCAPDYVGNAAATQDELSEFTSLVNAAGYTVQVHCMGDASAEMAVNAFEKSIEDNGEMDVRNKMTHCNLVTDEDLQKMADMNIIAAMQPLWFYYDPFFSPLEEQMFGEERFKSEYHIRDMVDMGIMITGSNDYPVTTDYAPLNGIEAGATQCSPYAGEDDKPEEYTRNADQAVSVYEMIQMYTTNGAYGAFLDDRIGTIETGKKADLVVLDRNLLTCDVKEISDAVVEYTISDGRIVYDGTEE